MPRSEAFYIAKTIAEFVSVSLFLFGFLLVAGVLS